MFIPFFLLSVVSTLDFQFSLDVRDVRCFEDTIGKNVLVVGSIECIYSNYSFTIKIPNKKEDPIILYSVGEPVTKFSFTTNQTIYKYNFCVQNLATIPLKFKYSYQTGAEAMDYTLLAQKEDLKPIEIEIEKLNNIVSTIEVVYTYLKKKKKKNDQKAIGEKQIQRFELLEVLSMKMIYFSLLTLGLMILANIFQTQKLKRFFKAKKLI